MLSVYHFSVPLRARFGNIRVNVFDREGVFKIHYLMLALTYVRALAMLFHGVSLLLCSLSWVVLISTCRGWSLRHHKNVLTFEFKFCCFSFEARNRTLLFDLLLTLRSLQSAINKWCVEVLQNLLNQCSIGRVKTDSVSRSALRHVCRVS